MCLPSDVSDTKSTMTLICYSTKSFSLFPSGDGYQRQVLFMEYRMGINSTLGVDKQVASSATWVGALGGRAIGGSIYLLDVWILKVPEFKKIIQLIRQKNIHQQWLHKALGCAIVLIRVCSFIGCGIVWSKNIFHILSGFFPSSNGFCGFNFFRWKTTCFQKNQL